MGNHNVNIRINAKDHASKVFKRIAMAAGGLLAFRTAGRHIKGSIGLFIEQESASKKLEQALRATGNAAGFNANQLKAYADELQNVTTVGDETWETAMSIMATFKQVQGDVFKESIKLAGDMSTALGTDLKSSVLQLGKALNEPTKGLTALTRSGVSFTSQQKEQIKTLTEQNNLMGAQRIMLDEISAQFGGQATAAAHTFGGALKQLSNAWGDARENMGRYLVEAAGFHNQVNAINLMTVSLQNMGAVFDVVLAEMRVSWLRLWEDMQFAMVKKINDMTPMLLKITGLMLGVEAKIKLGEAFKNVPGFKSVRELAKQGITSRPSTSAELAAKAVAETASEKLAEVMKGFFLSTAPALNKSFGGGGGGDDNNIKLPSFGGGRRGIRALESRFLGGAGPRSPVETTNKLLRQIVRQNENQARRDQQRDLNEKRRSGKQETIIKSLA